MHRRQPPLALTLAVLLALGAGSRGLAGPTAGADELRPRIDAIFADYDRPDAPGCALGVIRDGELVYKRGYGMANLEYGMPITSRSVFRIGSTSKQFTALAMLLLEQQGKLALDDDVRRTLPELPAHDPPVTLRHLIHHTSGYRDYLTLMSLAGMRDDDFATDGQVLDLLSRQRELNFPPGSEFLYSNSGYFLLSQVVARAGGMSLRQFAATEIFGPLGMVATHFHDDHTEIVAERATGYSPREGGGYRIHVTSLDMVGDGGVFTSVEDLRRWDRNFYDPQVGGEELLAAMLAPGVLAGGEATDYAAGLRVTDYHGLEKVSHGGGFVGYRAELIRFPSERLSVVCLCNRSDAAPSTLAQRVADLYLADHLPPAPPAVESPPPPPAAGEPPAESLAAFAGLFRRRGAAATFARIELEAGRLIYRVGGDSYPLAPISARRFRLEAAPAEVVVEFLAPEGSGRPRLEVRVEGEREARIYEPVAAARPAAGELAAYAGDYACDELATTLRVGHEEGRLRVAHLDPHKRSPEDPFEPAVADVFTSGSLVVEFRRDPAGRPEALLLHFGRVRNLRCLRAAAAAAR